MIAAVLRLAGLIALALLIAVVIAAIWSVPLWAVLVFLLAMVAIDSIGRDKAEPPDHLDQTGGFPRSRR